MRICLVSDAWPPQVNGVVRTLTRTRDEIIAMGHDFDVISPDRFRTIPCPTYPEIRLAVFPDRKVARLIEAFRPDAIHIATEGPLGLAARRYCGKHKLPFTTGYHTKFPEYLEARTRIPARWSYAAQRWFHGPAKAVMVATPTVVKELEDWGFRNLKLWTRGVEADLFCQRDKSTLELPELPDYQDLPRPIFVNVGRVAVEKNLDAFLSLDLPGTKLIVGDGPMMGELKGRYPDVRFVGMQHGEALAKYYACADVFVMPSLTETFGVVQLEALACGLPIAAFPAPGPKDLLEGTDVGVLHEDLRTAALEAAEIPADRCRAFALNFSWQRVAEILLENLAPFDKFREGGSSASPEKLPEKPGEENPVPAE